MKLWFLRQYEETLAGRDDDEVIGIFETKEDALNHISDELPEWAEPWKSNKDWSCYTNGVRSLTRYVIEVNTGEIFEALMRFKKHWSHKAEDVFF